MHGSGVINNMKRYRQILLLGLIALFVYLVFYGFPDSPSPWFDEGINLGIAKSWVKHGVYSLEIAPGEFVKERSLLITTNYPLLLWTALSFKIFGIGLWQAKIVMFAFLFVFAFLFYTLAKKYYGENNALASLAILITFLPFYGNGKSALGEIPGLTYFLGGLLLWENEKKWKVFLSGLLFGLAAATKSIYLIFVVSVFAGEFFSGTKFPLGNLVPKLKRVMVLSAGMAIPLLIWIYTLLPDNFTFDYLVKTWQLYRNPYNIESAALTNFLRFFMESTPIHFAFLFLASAWFLIWKPKNGENIKKVEIALAVFILLNLVFYLKTAGWYRYFFPAHILLFVLAPPALECIAGKFKNILITGLVAAQLAVLAVNIKQSLYYNPGPRRFAEAVNRAVPRGQGIFVFDLPEIVFLLNRDDVWHYLHANPHIAFGEDLLKTNRYPAYIISNSLPPGDKYGIKIDGGKYVLYERTK
ncbi:hypothetical protein A3I36_00775 [Candidatus Giovannonibacteria bacterium RIFCSPLOWO2_02_FULL_45_28]|uniref:Uncharacterized protein n=2 Tax=Candidatus Giovannoniibacteriota TaxID=1752738 RepID=A0A1F5WAP8_9BACT|nr:MAG: hypothetical protein UW15_C0011G0044 [Parcubacteria group bacterium GW2011_GWC1_44_10]KKT60456.1 MAG: hypothetical protein UW53_C0001G0106 [Candidatus Giovannonibacteria bacterium GW2011_GWA1_44_25]KKU30314.1 MAG: hypothetical protein UX43_C0001G0086 [Candidatus Giovannonibacteria bacterium GW2011_GWB1_46_20]OGF59652.1 MAG: hypothetical protein A2W40_04540 [Candidatus Giovannonibacteria bacterium RIFCSPHIGHO2_01_45_12]OGF72713.1 MAG: hypothetical protein A3C05_00350 [Candidatus Giovanno